MRRRITKLVAATVLISCGNGARPAVELAPHAHTKPTPIAYPIADGGTVCAHVDHAFGTPAAGMVRVPAGSFMSGSPENFAGRINQSSRECVSIKSFDIDRTEVTVAEYLTCVRAGACTSSPAVVCEAERTDCNDVHPERANHPVNCITFQQAEAFCAWSGKRLPTEQEWEFAARGIDERPYPWGSTQPHKQLCWAPTSGHSCNVKGWCSGGSTCPAGAFAGDQSPFGVFDMAGNVAEWTQTNRVSNADLHVARGGTWVTLDPSSDPFTLEVSRQQGEPPPAPVGVRAEFRSESASACALLDVGVRCARSVLH